MNLATRLPHEPASVAEARAASLRPLEFAVDRATLGTLRLLVSELVTNSIRHGRASSAGEIELVVRASPQAVRVEVADAGRGFSVRPRVAGQDEGSGWWLHLVDTLSESLGHRAQRPDADLVRDRLRSGGLRRLSPRFRLRPR